MQSQVLTVETIVFSKNEHHGVVAAVHGRITCGLTWPRDGAGLLLHVRST